ncbi:MAG: ABC transporter ATP-binding protein [Chloroflexi bacterium]|nr:ABC transporter ATP-binding protein [Chloroflexota bacterium]
MTGPAVRLTGVQKRFGDQAVLHGIDLDVAPNEFVSLLGPSGCGKTTLLRIIAGFEQVSAGRVEVAGVDVTGMPPHKRPTNLVFQRGALFPHMTVAENIGYSLKLRGWPKGRIAARVEELLALVRLEGLGGRGSTQLSGGQIQRAALARALAPQPTVLLLDEPLSALDLKLRQHMQLELRALQRQLAATFIYVTHDQTEALVMSDRIAIMDAGRLVQVGTPREIYTRPASVFASDFIGETNLVPGTVMEVHDGLVTLTAGRVTRLRGRADSPIAVGAAATLSVRPEAIRLTRSDASMDTVPPVDGCRGQVRQVVYLGSRVRVEVVTEDGITTWTDLREDEADGLSADDWVSLHWNPEAASIWAGETIRTEA